MTREEAIDFAKFLKNNWLINFADMEEFCDIAIEALEAEPNELETIDFAIDASNGGTNYYVGFRNGMRYVKSLIDGKEPQFESCAEQEPSEYCSRFEEE